MKDKTTVHEVFAAAYDGNGFSIDFQTCLALAVPLLILVVIACAIFKFNRVNKKIKEVNRGEA